MKVLLLNGSPRKGNTVEMLAALKRGLTNIENLELREIAADQVSVAPCKACNACNMNAPCVHKDDTNKVIDDILWAEAIVFATPVYWWDITAQLKLIIDKMYSQQNKLEKQDKKIGILLVGECELDDPQYTIIPKQFDCICDYLGWKIAFTGMYSALDPGDILKVDGAIEELEGFWQKLV